MPLKSSKISSESGEVRSETSNKLVINCLGMWKWFCYQQHLIYYHWPLNTQFASFPLLATFSPSCAHMMLPAIKNMLSNVLSSAAENYQTMAWTQIFAVLFVILYITADVCKQCVNVCTSVMAQIQFTHGAKYASHKKFRPDAYASL